MSCDDDGEFEHYATGRSVVVVEFLIEFDRMRVGMSI